MTGVPREAALAALVDGDEVRIVADQQIRFFGIENPLELLSVSTHLVSADPGCSAGICDIAALLNGGDHRTETGAVQCTRHVRDHTFEAAAVQA